MCYCSCVSTPAAACCPFVLHIDAMWWGAREVVGWAGFVAVCVREPAGVVGFATTLNALMIAMFAARQQCAQCT